MKIRLELLTGNATEQSAEAFFLFGLLELSSGEQSITDIYRDLFVNLVGIKLRKLTFLFLRHEPLAKITYQNENLKIAVSERLRDGSYVRREFTENIDVIISYLNGCIDCLQSMTGMNENEIQTIRNESLGELSQGACPFFSSD